jgi:hypothetical protein
VFILFLQQAETKATNRATAEETTRARARERERETRKARQARTTGTRETVVYRLTLYSFATLPLCRLER